MKKEIQPTDFSENLFWDVDSETLNMERHAKYIIARVLELGTLADWRLLCRRFTLPGIVEISKKLRVLDSKALEFLSVVGRTPKKEFRCYTPKQSMPTPWNS